MLISSTHQVHAIIYQNDRKFGVALVLAGVEDDNTIAASHSLNAMTGALQAASGGGTGEWFRGSPEEIHGIVDTHLPNGQILIGANFGPSAPEK